MQNHDHKGPSTLSRRLVGVALAAGLLVAVVLSVLLLTREDQVGVNEPHLPPTTVGPSHTSNSREDRTEIVGRLESILKTRDEAFRTAPLAC
jgi:hypothetical protein